MAAPSGGVRRSYASAGALATRRELLERRLVDAVRGHDDRPHRRRRVHRRLALAALQECHLAQQRARTELGDLLAVNLDVDDAVQDQEQLATLVALLDQLLTGVERPPLELRATAHDRCAQLALELQLDSRRQRRRVL